MRSPTMAILPVPAEATFPPAQVMETKPRSPCIFFRSSLLGSGLRLGAGANASDNAARVSRSAVLRTGNLLVLGNRRRIVPDVARRGQVHLPTTPCQEM